MRKPFLLIFGCALQFLTCPAIAAQTNTPNALQKTDGASDKEYIASDIENDPSFIPSFLRGVTVTAGLSAKQLDLDYSRKGQEEVAGSISEGMYNTYFIRVGTPYRLNKNGTWGYYFEWDYSSFKMTKQNVGDEEQDLGTSVEGYSWFITPVGFYQWGPYPSFKTEYKFITGVGVGVGYIDAAGDMILTEDGSNEYIKVDEKGFGISANLLFEIQYWNLMTRIYGGGTIRGDDQGVFEAFHFAWDIGYTYTF